MRLWFKVGAIICLALVLYAIVASRYNELPVFVIIAMIGVLLWRLGASENLNE